MSELRARSGSKLRAFAGSKLRAYGPGFKTLFLPGTSEVLMTWEVEWFRYNLTTDTVLETKAGVVVLHERYYHVNIHLMGSPNGRGTCIIDSMSATVYESGTPNIDTDLVSSNGLTELGSSDVSVGNFSWTGWPNATLGPTKASHIDTGTTMEFYGRLQVNAVSLDDPKDVEGIYLHDPAVLLPSAIPDDWIMIYLTDAGGLTVENLSAPEPDESIVVVARVKCVITA